MTLAELKRLAQAAMPIVYENCSFATSGVGFMVDTIEQAERELAAACTPQYIVKLVACVEAADHWIVVGQCPRYDAARAALDEPEPDDTTKAAIAGVKELAKQFETRLKGPKP